MLFRKTFYESYNFTAIKDKEHVTTTRRQLIKDLGIQQKDKYTLDVQIQINTPRMYYKPRHIGSLHKSNNFKSMCDQCSKSVNISPSADIRQLVRVSISKKKLRQEQDNIDNSFIVRKETNTSTNSIALLRSFRLKDETKEDKAKKAAQYLIRQGELLKSYLKKEKPTNEFRKRLASISKSFKLPKNSEDVGGTVHDELSKIRKYPSPDDTKSNINSLIKIIDEDIIFRPIQQKSKSGIELFKGHVTECKKEVKRKRKRKFNTSTAISSGLSFAERMEQLAIGRIIN
jgi:hypothetical protein